MKEKSKNENTVEYKISPFPSRQALNTVDVTTKVLAKSALAKSVLNKIPDNKTINNLANLFKNFSDPTRAKIISCLEVRDLTVSELGQILEMSVSAVSHQLRVLRSAKLVKGTKEGKEVKYSLDDNHVAMIMECGLTHINE